MGRIKELREKAKKGLTKEEQEELDELVAEAEETPEESSTADKEAEDNPEEEVDKLADRFVDKVAPVVKKLDSVLDAINKHGAETKVEVDGGRKYIIDPKFGKKSVEELEDIKLELPGRKQQGKKHYEVSLKSMHAITAFITGDVQKLQVLVEGTGARGGFLVPDDYANVLIEDIRDQTVMRQLATVMTTDSDTLHVPSLLSRPRAAFRAEAAVKSTSTVDFAENVLTPYSLAAIVTLSRELVADAKLGVGASIVSKVGELMAQAIAEREDRAFWTGSGSGEPTGLNSYTFTTVAAGAGASDAVKADSLIRSFWRLGQGYRNRAAFVANSQTWEKVATLKDSQNNYLLSRLGDSPYRTILGRPIYEQNNLEAGVIFVGDFSPYVIADREGVRIDTSEEATVASQSAFERNLVHVRAEKRVDGELTRTDTIVEVTGMGTP